MFKPELGEDESQCECCQTSMSPSKSGFYSDSWAMMGFYLEFTLYFLKKSWLMRTWKPLRSGRGWKLTPRPNIASSQTLILLCVAFIFVPSLAFMAKRAMPQPIVFVTGNAKKLEEAENTLKGFKNRMPFKPFESIALQRRFLKRIRAGD